MKIIDPYGFVVRESDDDMQRDHDLVHERCGETITRIEHDDNMGTLVSMMNDHACPRDDDDESES